MLTSRRGGKGVTACKVFGIFFLTLDFGTLAFFFVVTLDSFFVVTLDSLLLFIVA